MQPTVSMSFGELTALKVTRYGNMLYHKKDVYIGKSIENYGEYSYGESQLFEVLARPGNTVLDVGANIGCHTLCLAHAVKAHGRVLAFEPQRFVFQTLCANIALNSLTNVYSYHAAVGKTPGTITIPVLDYAQAGNYGGLGLEENQVAGESVSCLVIDNLALSACHVIKIDVEGMELDVLEGAAYTIHQFMPILYLENDRKDKSPALLAFLFKAGYRVYWHLPLLFNPNNYDGNTTDLFPDTVSINILAIPGFCAWDLKGFKEIHSPDAWWRSA